MSVINSVTEFLWGYICIFLVCICGFYFTVKGRFYQLRTLPRAVRTLIRSGGKKRGINGFDTVCTTLAASIGVGNIAGVAAALALGGAGAVFWIWVCALIGMATSFAENALGGRYSVVKNGVRTGGAMYYLRDGVGGVRGRILSFAYAAGTVAASFGIGNMSQMSAVSENIGALFPCMAGTPGKAVTGIAVALPAFLMLRGGLARVGRATRFLVPAMAFLYIFCCAVTIAANGKMLGQAVICIFRSALCPRAGIGAGAGAALSAGFRRGVFTSEAGIGSSVNALSASDLSPCDKGRLGMTAVFLNTAVMCTVTALVILTSGASDLSDGLLRADCQPMTLVSGCFGAVLGNFGRVSVTVCVLLFAFTTIVGWACYGLNSWTFFTELSPGAYLVIYFALLVFSSVCGARAAFALSDLFNVFMMLPNIAGLLILRKQALEIMREKG